MRGIKIRNETAWSTDDLREIVERCLADRGATGPRLVTFAYRRARSRRLGCAEYGGRSRMFKVGKRWVESTEGYAMRINLPRPGGEDEGGAATALAEVFHVATGTARFEMRPDLLRQVLITVEHEVDHTMGLRHADMVADQSRPCLWATVGFLGKPPLGIQLARREPDDPIARRELEIAKHQAAIKRMRTRIARLETMIDKRERKIRGLESANRRQAARKESGHGEA